MPTISVLVCTHRRNSLLKEALDSLSAQTFRDWEAIIVDNSGRYAARHVVHDFREGRFIYLPCSRNYGECGGRNIAFRHSSGDYICYLDDDDLLPSDSLQSRVEFYRQYPDCGMIYAEFERFRDINGVRVPELDTVAVWYRRKCYYDSLLARLGYNQRDTFYLLKKFNFVRGGTPLIHRRTIETVGLFDECLVNFGNYEMWLRIAARFCIRFLNTVVYYYRRHEGSILERTPREVATECAQVICRRHRIRGSLQFADLLAFNDP